MPIRIRPAAPADAPALADLARRTFVATFGHLYPETDLTSFLEGAYSETHQRRELEDPLWVTLLAERDGVPLGYAQVVLDHPAPGLPALPAPMELNRFYLEKEAHGSGLANTLMEAVVQAARDHGGRTLWLGVWEHNHRARAFYERWGFTYAGEHFFQVGTKADTDHILVRALPEPPPNTQ